MFDYKKMFNFTKSPLRLEQIIEFGNEVKDKIQSIKGKFETISNVWRLFREEIKVSSKIQKNVIETVFGSAESTILADRNVIEEDVDDGSFTILPPKKIFDIIKRMRRDDGSFNKK